MLVHGPTCRYTGPHVGTRAHSVGTRADSVGTRADSAVHGQTAS